MTSRSRTCYRVKAPCAFRLQYTPRIEVLYGASRRRRPAVRNDIEEKDAKFSKPSPEIFEAARRRTRTSPERTLIVGDTPYDILAAHRSAMAIAAVLSGGFERRLLKKAEFLFDDVEELVEKIDKVDEYFQE